VGVTVVSGDFEWDEEKATENVRKHGVTFEEASAVFADMNALVEADDAAGELRLEVIGRIFSGILFVVAVERGARDRIISAREATRFEIRRYEEEAR
jgi:uncharacterized protein